jgi:hypothetical protein
MSRILLAGFLLLMPFTVTAQTQGQVYVSRLSDCIRNTMELDDSFVRIVYSFQPADSFSTPQTAASTKVDTGYRNADIQYLDVLGDRPDLMVREVVVHEHLHVLLADLRHAIWNMIFDRYLTTLPPEVAAGRTNHMVHRLFHPIVARLERWDVWQQVCSVDDLYR